MATRENKFAKPRGNVNLRDLTKAVNDINQKDGHAATQILKTEKQVEDIDINLIDEYDRNESMFGYNNLEDVINSIKKTGVKGVTINVFTKDDGRYLCYSGNTRLRAMKEIGEKKITCIIEGPMPDEHELMLRAIYGNKQRTFDPYHIAQEIEMLEKSFRDKGLIGATLTEEIEAVTGYKLTAQKMYKQILKLNPILQSLFDAKDIPYQYLLKVCKTVPDDKAEAFKEMYEIIMKDVEPSRDLINLVYTKVMQSNSKLGRSVTQNVKLSREYKTILSLSCDDNGDYFVPESKKEEYLRQVTLLEQELEKIKKACE